MYWKRETESHRFSICSYHLGGSYFPNSCRLARLKSGTGNSILLSRKGGGPLSPEPSPAAPRCTSSKLKLNCRAGTGMQLSGLPHNIYLPPPAMFWNQGICTFLMETIISFFFLLPSCTSLCLVFCTPENILHLKKTTVVFCESSLKIYEN